LNPLEELKLLDAEIDRAGDLERLRPIFHRLDEIAQQHSSDFEVQLAASDLKQKLLDRGNHLRDVSRVAPVAAASAPSRTPRFWIAAAAALLLLVVAGVVVIRQRSVRFATAEVALEIVTVPPGAAVSINGTVQCTSNCLLSLPAGNYQVRADLDGYDPAVSQVSLSGGKPASLIFPLEARTSLKILSDLDRGKVAIDNEAPADLVEGQFELDPVPPGKHVVKVTGGLSETSFTFEANAAKLPVTEAMTSRNMVALAVASLGNHANVTANSGPIKLVVNGQAEMDAGPGGAELKNFKQGVNELTIGEARDQRTMRESFGATPMLTVFLKSDLNIGTLIVATGEDDVRVSVNGKEYRRKTQYGEVRIPAIGNVNVKVAKDGFDDTPPRTAEVKKGSETRLEFKLHATPKTATLIIAGATPGADVLIDQRGDGVIGPDGSFTDTTLTPGNHGIELRKEKFIPKRYERRFVAGQTVTISGEEALLEAERLPPPPPPPPKKVEVVKEKAPPPPAAGTLEDFEDGSLWHPDNGVFVHRGGGFLPYKMPPNGIFTFTIQSPKGGLFRGGKVRWRLMYLDARDYAEFEIGNNNFISRVVQNGKAAERTRVLLKDLDKLKSLTIQIDVSPEHVIHKLRSGSGWLSLDAWSEPGVHFADGKFGFFVQGKDEIALTDFKLQPK
jgi:hypothetical protein